MPPFGFRKRELSPSPASAATPKASTSKRAKPTLLERSDTPTKKSTTLEDNRQFLEELGSDDSSSLSDADSDEFEDVPPPKRRKVVADDANDSEDDDDEDEMEWEDAIQQESSTHPTPSAINNEREITDINISIKDGEAYVEPTVSAATGKKGPSKRERQARISTHCLHVQALMRHNTVRNSWLNNEEVQKALTDGLPENIKRDVRAYKDAIAQLLGKKPRSKASEGNTDHEKKGKKGKQKDNGRDWNNSADYLDPDNRMADPSLQLFKILTAYWRKKFTVTAPGLRKQGYKQLRRLRDDVRGWAKDRKNFEEFGERIESVQDFCRLATKCEGSRDVGAQLFVALLRALGFEARMVANLQPIGFGWSKGEEADPPKQGKKKNETVGKVQSDDGEQEQTNKATAKSAAKSQKTKQLLKAEKPARKSARGNKADPINLDDSDSPLSSVPSDNEEKTMDIEDSDDDSVIDVTPSAPKKKITRKYDRDLAFPNYWIEVCSPITTKFYPVDPIVLATIASNEELLQTFEPRGKRAENAKQVICYTVAFSSDGSAKDVTVRYLKRHQLPGKTKGVRLAVEKVPILNRRGKVKRYEEYDFFGSLMLLYQRPEDKRTPADDLEDTTDLKPYKPAKEEKKVTKESLAGYKQSADYVLEQHLRREEAILPHAEPVKYFTSGKGDKEQEIAVYSRNDVVSCKTVESWHKEGRAVRQGEQPLKYVPVRAVTLIRKREIEDVQRETGEKMKQGLYSEAQTGWIIPPPIENGVIPKNAFGNMDVYVPTMVPKGAKHLPLKGSAKLCKKLGIDFAEACTGFEFGKQRAVPVLTGVVVAVENATLVRDAWRAEQKEIERKQNTKRTAAALHWWRKMLLGLRVLERMRVEYADGGDGADLNPFVKRDRASRIVEEDVSMESIANTDLGGGFFPPGYDEEEVPNRRNMGYDQDDDDEAGGFLLEDESALDATGGGFLVDDEVAEKEVSAKSYAPITPISLQSLHKDTDGLADTDADGDVSFASSRAAQVKPSAKQKKAKQTKKKGSGKAPRRRITPTPSVDEDEDEDQSPLSSPSASLADSEEVQESDNSDNASPPPPTKKQKANSPQVIVSRSSRPKPRAAKSTPTRSQYFKHESEDEANDDEDDDMSEVEVVKPRQTTSRTRARG